MLRPLRAMLPSPGGAAERPTGRRPSTATWEYARRHRVKILLQDQAFPLLAIRYDQAPSSYAAMIHTVAV